MKKLFLVSLAANSICGMDFLLSTRPMALALKFCTEKRNRDQRPPSLDLGIDVEMEESARRISDLSAADTVGLPTPGARLAELSLDDLVHEQDAHTMEGAGAPEPEIIKQPAQQALPPGEFEKYMYQMFDEDGGSKAESRSSSARSWTDVDEDVASCPICLSNISSSSLYALRCGTEKEDHFICGDCLSNYKDPEVSARNLRAQCGRCSQQIDLRAELTKYKKPKQKTFKQELIEALSCTK